MSLPPISATSLRSYWGEALSARRSDTLPSQMPVCYSLAGGASAKAIQRYRPEPNMSVDAATVRRIAHLSRIAVADSEVEHLRGELNAILAFVEQLSEVDVSGVEPMTSVTPMTMKKREDKVTDGNIAEDILRNAPVTEGSCFAVPKVVE
jgi:aspartyl-tRNA(Asn)/glutamyl-tRNA(Gln) amidotransferase subunit C